MNNPDPEVLGRSKYQGQVNNRGVFILDTDDAVIPEGTRMVECAEGITRIPKIPASVKVFKCNIRTDSLYEPFKSIIEKYQGFWRVRSPTNWLGAHKHWINTINKLYTSGLAKNLSKGGKTRRIKRKGRKTRSRR